MKLLVAVDFSPQTEALLAVSQRLAQALGGELRLLHVASPTSLIKHHPETQHEQEEPVGQDNEHRLLREAVARARDAGIEATGILVEGPPAKTILSQAENLPAEMIIMGSHGFGATLSLILGSVSKKVLKNARCPVLLVPVRATQK